MLGRGGFDINNPDKSLPGMFTGLQLKRYFAMATSQEMIQIMTGREVAGRPFKCYSNAFDAF
jgi:hypothetical protein